MYKNLIEDAKNEGLEGIVVEALIKKESGEILLTQDLQAEKPIYGFPSAELKEEETIGQALQRAVTVKTAMQIEEVIWYLGHYDQDGVRHYHFITKVSDPYALEESRVIAYAWLHVEDAVGYPITDNLREILDLYARHIS